MPPAPLAAAAGSPGEIARTAARKSSTRRRKANARRARSTRTWGDRRMPDLSTNCGGIRSPNPFWLASAPPANSGAQVQRAFDHGWGGAVWKTLGVPIQNVSSRFGAVDVRGIKAVGFNNIELITDRSLEVNFREIYETKKKYPGNAVVVSLMVETRE